MTESLVEQALRIARLLDGLGIPYLAGGSIASSLLGEPRSTLDIDLVVQLRSEKVGPLVSLLSRDFAVDEETARQAAEDHLSFAAVHLSGAFKIDFFVLEDTPLARRQMERRQKIEVTRDGDSLFVYAPEDIVIQKLRWYEMGGRVSDRQWRDVLGIIKVQGARLDPDYLAMVAGELGLTELLTKAMSEAQA